MLLRSLFRLFIDELNIMLLSRPEQMSINILYLLITEPTIRITVIVIHRFWYVYCFKHLWTTPSNVTIWRNQRSEPWLLERTFQFIGTDFHRIELEWFNGIQKQSTELRFYVIKFAKDFYKHWVYIVEQSELLHLLLHYCIWRSAFLCLLSISNHCEQRHYVDCKVEQQLMTISESW